jgi:hypothetical protein
MIDRHPILQFQTTHQFYSVSNITFIIQEDGITTNVTVGDQILENVRACLAEAMTHISQTEASAGEATNPHLKTPDASGL